MNIGMIFGNGVSGQGAKKLLEKMKYDIVMVDDKTGLSSEIAEELVDKMDIFIKSPGIPYTSLVKKALDFHIEVIDEVELAYRYMKKVGLKAKIIAITGSNGKTTITKKITELLKKAGYKAAHAGNIGNSFSELILENEDLDYVVLELSSYQLETLKEFKADISMVINLSPDHLNRYKSESEYFDAKFRITRNQTEKDIFIYNLNDDESLKRIQEVNCKKLGVSIGKSKNIATAYIDDDKVYYQGKEILEIDKLSLKGKHNLENILFILTTAKIIDIDDEIIKEFLYTTRPLEHRLEKFYKWKNYVFINDSKGTNGDATSYAIKAYPNSILICGGKDKGLSLEKITKEMKEYTKEIYLIGEMAERLEENLIKNGYEKEKIHFSGTLETAIKTLRDRAEIKIKNGIMEKENILLSPATSSFDQFPNFETRGKVFKDLVKEYFREGVIL